MSNTEVQEYYIPQSFASGLSYNGKLEIRPVKSHDLSTDVFIDILPKGSEVVIYSKLVLGMDVSDEAFNKIKSQKAVDYKDNPRKGEAVFIKEGKNISVEFFLGKEQVPVTLQKIDKDILTERALRILIIEKNMTFDNLPKKTLKVPTAKYTEKRHPYSR